MTKNRITIRLSVPIKMFREDSIHVAGCEPLQVYSQGATPEEARKNVEEALSLFVVSCFERGTLERVLLDSGFTPDLPSGVMEAEDEPETMVHVPLPLISHGQAHAA